MATACFAASPTLSLGLRNITCAYVRLLYTTCYTGSLCNSSTALSFPRPVIWIELGRGAGMFGSPLQMTTRLGCRSTLLEPVWTRSASWGTDIEIIALSHMLNTFIASYSVERASWQIFNPRFVDGENDLSQGDQQAMYIHHNVNHYSAVTSVKQYSD